MFSSKQKREIYENSVKVNDNNKYIEIMGYFSDHFEKAKATSIKRKVIFILLLILIVYMVCQNFIFKSLATRELIFRGSAIFVGTLVFFKLGTIFLNYIDDLPIIDKIKNKECDLLCYEGDLTDLTFSLSSSVNAINNYYMIVSGNKLQINRNTYKTLLKNKGSKIRIYYFAELLTRQVMISDASVIMVVE